MRGCSPTKGKVCAPPSLAKSARATDMIETYGQPLQVQGGTTTLEATLPSPHGSQAQINHPAPAPVHQGEGDGSIPVASHLS
jgi:hypothetical protein